MILDGVTRAASLQGPYRYSLTRDWTTYPPDDDPWWDDHGLAPAMVFIMLNPSTADDRVDDPTIRRCMGFARREGVTRIEVVNLFALRATDPSALREVAFSPVSYGGGDHNDRVLRDALASAGEHAPVVAAWGAHAMARERAEWLLEQPFAQHLHALGVTKDGSPRHPLYVKGDAPLLPWYGYGRA